VSRPLLVDRWQLARALDVHPHTVYVWLREGLDVALVKRGAPHRPALFDGQRALDWFNRVKADGRPFTPRTLTDLKAVVQASTTPRRDR